MEIRHLRCFLAIAEERHLARAAEKAYIDQSTLSRAIKELEEELGVVQFNRSNRFLGLRSRLESMVMNQFIFKSPPEAVYGALSKQLPLRNMGVCMPNYT